MLEGCIPWPAALANRYRSEGVWRDETLGEMLDAAAARSPADVALVAEGERFTYRQVLERTNRLAEHLLHLGLGPGDRLVMQLPNVPEFVFLYFAAVKIGVLPVMALPAHRASEIGYFLEHAQASAYAIPGVYRKFDYVELAHELKATHSALHLVLVADPEVPEAPGFVSIPKLLETSAPARTAPRPDPFDVGLFLLSGGTTGLPKLIPRTHADYLYNARQTNEICGITRESVLLLAIPVSHNFALACPGLVGFFTAGGRVVLVNTPDPEVVLDTVERERVTCMPGVPALHQSVMDRQEAAPRDLSSLRQILAGGSKFLPAAADRAMRVLGCEVQQVIGMAEGFISFTRLGDPREVVLETVGRPISSHDEFRLVEEGRDVTPGRPGELWVRGPYTIRGYYRAPEHNAKAFTEDGFYRTGDVLRLDEGGNLVVEGRVKDMINRAGEKISAEEVEDLVIDHPKIQSAALVAMPDRLVGEKGCLFVVCRPGQTLTLGEVLEHLGRKRVAKFKFPERLEVIEKFPLTAVGKVSKRELRERIQRTLEAETGGVS